MKSKNELKITNITKQELDNRYSQFKQQMKKSHIAISNLNMHSNKHNNKKFYIVNNSINAY